LTRTYLYTAARKETAWTAGGLQAPVDLSTSESPLKCFNVEKAVPSGWQAADFKPDTGAYRCDEPIYKYTGQNPRPMTLGDVGNCIAAILPTASGSWR
jgi:hypothetical protein